MPFEYGLHIDPAEKFADIPLSPDGRAGLPLRAFISLRKAGNMHFQKRNELPHREELFTELSLDARRVFSVVQKHTQEVLTVDGGATPEDFSETVADGLVTRERTPMLTATVADCLPIFVIDKRTLSFGVVHSGWKGTGIIVSAIRLMRERFGSSKKDIRVVIGPGIGTCCYTVDKERATIFAATFGENAVMEEKYKYVLDMRQANLNLLAREGIDDVMVCTDCTSCNPLLSSFRRDGKPDFIAMLAGIYFSDVSRIRATREAE